MCQSFAQVLTSWIVDQVKLGYKAPLPGYKRFQFCPSCRPVERTLDTRHVLLGCPGVAVLRAELGITAFISECEVRGLTNEEVYSAYVNGLGADGGEVTETQLDERGAGLERLRDVWLDSWGARYIRCLFRLVSFKFIIYLLYLS